MQLHIRPGTDADRSELIAIQALAIASFYQDVYTSEQIGYLTELQVKGMNKRRQSFVVAEMNGESVGFAALSKVSSIDAVYILPQWMRQGIGKQLVLALEDIALRKRCSKLSVIAAATASGFYQSQGYEVLGQFDYQLGHFESVPCDFLQKKLRDQVSLELWERMVLVGFFIGAIAVVGLMVATLNRRQPPQDAPPLRNILEIKYPT
jgi:N-acetylglutamate synthase-like GNAT family acetyltransferase